MAIMGLNLPTDIPWKQTCVTQDMMASEACEPRHPPKWQSSIAVSQYVPEEEYQVYPGRKVTYVKVTCTITGYQPRDKEIEGRINFRGVSVQTINNLDSLLEAYLPCTGALIQVAVSPRKGGVVLDNYPYFMDFQPKKRELYEMVTETGERSSRSVEALKIGKASGSSESVEVLDIDQGGSVGASGSVSYAGIGVSGSYQESHQGQWGTKQIGAQESSVSRSTDESREKRESDSHTTQLSQMYHLLDSYHQGTNRALFFVQPRPHILEMPTGFVRGPRSVEGIQEFFLVVNQPKDQEGFEISVRLDTSHLTVVPIMDYDRSRTDTVYCKASADIPTREDAPDARQQISLVSDGDRVGTIKYNCFKREAHSSTPYVPPAGYKIDLGNNDGYIDTVNVGYHGTSHVDVDPSGESLTVYCDAVSHVCTYEDHTITVLYSAPDNVKDDVYKWPASAERDVLVFLISREPTKKIGDKNVLLITTRELCCGTLPKPRASKKSHRNIQGIADVVGLADWGGKALSLPPSKYSAVTGRASLAAVREDHARASTAMERNMGQTMTAYGGRASSPAASSCDAAAQTTREGERSRGPEASPSAGTSRSQAERSRGEDSLGGAGAQTRMTAREANELTATIRDAMLQSVGSRRRDGAEPVPYIETDLFHLQLQRQMLQTPPGRELLLRPVTEVLEEEMAVRLERHFRRPADQIPCGRIVDQSVEDLARILDIDLAGARRLKLACLDVPLYDTPGGCNASAE